VAETTIELFRSELVVDADSPCPTV
jgi:hypothetical protein